MPYLIDSNWLIDHLEDVSAASELLERLTEEGIAISIISYMEAYQGLERSPSPEQAQAKFQALIESIPILSFSTAVAKRCARLRETLKRQGKRVNARALAPYHCRNCPGIQPHPGNPQYRGL